MQWVSLFFRRFALVRLGDVGRERGDARANLGRREDLGLRAPAQHPAHEFVDVGNAVGDFHRAVRRAAHVRPGDLVNVLGKVRTSATLSTANVRLSRRP